MLLWAYPVLSVHHFLCLSAAHTNRNMPSHQPDSAQQQGLNGGSFRRPRVNVADGRAFVYNAESAATLLSEHRMWATPVGVRLVALWRQEISCTPCRKAAVPTLLVARCYRDENFRYQSSELVCKCSTHAVKLPSYYSATKK